MKSCLLVGLRILILSLRMYKEEENKGLNLFALIGSFL